MFGEQLGPGRSSRAMAIVHIAIFDAVNAIAGGYRSYTGICRRAPSDASMEAAIAQAAHDTLVALFPSQAATLRRSGSRRTCATIRRRGRAKDRGHRARPARGRGDPRAAQRTTARSTPSRWWASSSSRATSPGTGARIRSARSRSRSARTGARSTPFVLAVGAISSACRRRPRIDERASTRAAFDEVKRLGGDGVDDADRAHRASRRLIGDLLGLRRHAEPVRAAAPLQPDRGADRATQRGTDVRRARAAARARQRRDGRRRHRDLGVEVLLQFWRPVTGIREADPGTGPTGARRRQPATRSAIRPSRRSARRRATSPGPNFTPPFPAYPSGHAGFGGALFQMLRDFYGTDDIAFTFVSDEFNGVTRDNDGNVRPLLPRSFRIALAGRGGERPEPHLPRHPLVVRQDRGDRAGPARGELRLQQRLRAGGGR